MAPVSRRVFYQPAGWFALGAVLTGLAAALAWRALDGLPDAPPPFRPAPPRDGHISAPPPVFLDPELLVVFQPRETESRDDFESALAQRYRLAGTFFVEPGNSLSATRRAVMVDQREDRDRIVGEGDTLEDLTVALIALDHVILQSGRQRAVIRLGGRYGLGGPAGAGGIAAAAAPAEEPAGRFGEQINAYRWAFRRDLLIDYYQEVMRSPRRLKAVFDSMKPLYDDHENISGYVLDIEGEADFFREVGLREGDIVRSVNHMAMTNRRRAEYLIGEFVRDRLNVFILEVEREGRPVRQIYEVR